jgi:hypothetical protein
MWAIFVFFSKKMKQKGVNYHPMGENSPNLVIM